MDGCVFCKIVRGEIPTQKVYEDESLIAFLDINPVAEGHTLLVPKKHDRWFIDMADEDSDKLFRGAKSLAKSIKEKYNADFVRLGIVGKDVPHVHIHLIPQKLESDGPRV